MNTDELSDGFVTDVRRSARCWLAAPALPLTVVLFAFIEDLPAIAAPRPWGCGSRTPCASGSAGAYLGYSIFTLPFLAAALGFLGAQRVWYADIWAGRRPYLSWALGLSWRYVGRYMRLGLLVMAVLIVIDLLTPGGGAAEVSIYFFAVTWLLDACLTFVTPALAFTTNSASRALVTGWHELRRGWPANAAYVLVPRFAVSLTLRSVPAITSGKVGIGALVGANLLTSLLAGATAFRYLRETGGDG